MRVKMSLLALYKANPDLFEELELPEGADVNEIIPNLLLETADRDTLYTDAEFMQTYIGIWSHKKMEEWQLVYDALNKEYDPIENYDRIEESTDTKDITDTKNWADDHTETRNLANGNTETRNLSHTNTENRNLANGGTVTESTAAYDSNSFENKNKSVASGTDTGTVDNYGADTGTVSNSGTDTGTLRHAGTDTGTLRSAGSMTRNSRIHGNIGIRTSTEILKEFIDYRSKVCFADIVIQDFIHQFISLVY